METRILTMNGWVLFCIVFVASARSCYGFCQFPPDLWCSTPEIADECHVSGQCHEWSCVAKVDAMPVDVVIYYESFCSECIHFMDDHVDLAHKEVGKIMSLQLVPHGNTEEKRDVDSWKFTCLQGDDQCSANILQACVIDLVKNIEVQVPLIKCMMTTIGQPEANAEKCALDLGGIDWAEIKRCSREDLGRELEHQMAIRTKALKTPEDSNLPLVTVNGVLVGEISKKTGTDFVNLICQHYQGPFPYGCRMQQSNPSHACHTA